MLFVCVYDNVVHPHPFALASPPVLMKRAEEGLQERAVLEGRDCIQLQLKFRVLGLHSRTHKQTAASEQGGTVRMI
jgi:hypothetical protein